MPCRKMFEEIQYMDIKIAGLSKFHLACSSPDYDNFKRVQEQDLGYNVQSLS